MVDLTVQRGDGNHLNESKNRNFLEVALVRLIFAVVVIIVLFAPYPSELLDYDENQQTDLSIISKLSIENAIKSFQEEEEPSQPEEISLPPRTWNTAEFQVCYIVRTHYKHANNLQSLLDSVIIPKERVRNIATRAFLVETHARPQSQTEDSNTTIAFSDILDSAVIEGTKRAGDPKAVQLMEAPFIPNPKARGYDKVDFALERLLDNTTDEEESDLPCSHIVVTDGNNYYLPHFFDALPKHMRENEFIAWNYIDDHSGGKKRVRIVEGFIPMGAFIVSADVLRSKDVNFGSDKEPFEINTMKEYADAEWSFIGAAREGIPHFRVQYIRKILFVLN